MKCPKDAVPTHVEQRATASESLIPIIPTNLNCRCSPPPGLSPSLPLPCNPRSLSLRIVVDGIPSENGARQKQLMEDLIFCPQLRSQLPTLSQLLWLRLISTSVCLYVSGAIDAEKFYMLSAMWDEAQATDLAAINSIHQSAVKDKKNGTL